MRGPMHDGSANETRFDPRFFRRFPPGPGQAKRLMESAWRDFDIASQDRFKEVKFTYAYQALIKGGIALLAKVGAVKAEAFRDIT